MKNPVDDKNNDSDLNNSSDDQRKIESRIGLQSGTDGAGKKIGILFIVMFTFFLFSVLLFSVSGLNEVFKNLRINQNENIEYSNLHLEDHNHQEDVLIDDNKDTDGDGLTDEEEEEIGSDKYKTDTDDDGLSDFEEVEDHTGVLNPDTDGDGLKDGEDDCPHTNIIECQNDADGDGIGDRDEEKIGTDPKNSDTDEDGFSDKEEIYAGSDPLSASLEDKSIVEAWNLKNKEAEIERIMAKFDDKKGEDGWIYDVCADISIYPEHMGEERWQISPTGCVGPQCGSGILVSDNSVDFSNYPARETCKEIGGRLPSVEELNCLGYNGWLIDGLYWSNSESQSSGNYDYTEHAYVVNSSSRRRINDKDFYADIYCVKDIN